MVNVSEHGNDIFHFINPLKKDLVIGSKSIMNIWIAASDGKIDKVKEFIANGQTPNDRDINGYTCMHAAASYAHRELMDYLVSVGGDINVTDEDGDTPLHVVEDKDMAQYMVETLKADPKKKNSDGQTALQKIEEEDEFPELVEYLRSLSPDLEAEKAYGNESENIIDVPDNTNIRYTMESVPEAEDDPERRAQIEAILRSDNPDEGLRQFIREAVHSQLSGESSEGTPEKKRTKTD